MSDTIGSILNFAALAFLLGCIVVIFSSAHELADITAQHQEDYGLGSVVTTTAEYEYITNDSFTGVVVKGDCVRDQTLTIRDKDGVERVFASEFLEPVR